MHIPDGFISVEVAVAAVAASAATAAYSIKKIKNQSSENIIPEMGILAAFVFAAQMVNFPVAGGTSGHLVGGALLAILFGPFRACIIMSTILIAQTLLFADGGITAIGANILNMGIVAPFSAYFVFKLLKPFGFKLSVFVASWISIVLSAIFCAAELALSGTIPLKVALPAMAGVHALIGIGEGLITVPVVAGVLRYHKSLIKEVS